ncbi:glutamine amidotransferase [Halorhodospira halophila]|uniref:Glutamine amidotransferase class-I n=1 Tax=Halorhodospira halophila (strain DSM 244 / SL1) TaxID=349124 RepID=A1WWR4_HALHL|nr:glutamine amidotransferase [Halorhodospira halophila]ABM62126.1 glutamine amidotransferase class-I [Halorhodospira halophila SL1]MBK1729454.1 GMP synthase [Halorhodospira halophila]
MRSEHNTTYAETVWVIKTGRTLPPLRWQGDFEDWIGAGLGGTPWRTVDATDGPASLPDPLRSAGIIVTGSPAMVSHREPWSEAAAEWLSRAAHADIPILGICYGHQLLAHALGGRAGPNPRGREIGTVSVQRLAPAGDDPLFAHLPERFPAHVTHEESVLELPEGAVTLAANDHDAYQAFRWGRHAWGVQFHPEFDTAITRGYIFQRRPDLRREGFTPLALYRGVEATPEATGLLKRFAGYATAWAR